MSRTYVHRPYWVRVNDGNDQQFTWFWRGSRWGWTKIFTYRDCGCRLCTAHFGRRAENRQSRHEARRQAREVVKGGGSY